jgi:hypothetical protein
MTKLEINFSPKDTVAHLLNVLKINIESLYYGLQLIENEPVLPDRLKKEDDFFHLQMGKPLSELDLQENLKQILLSKCFEDLIKGLTLSLCDAYTLLNCRMFLCTEKILSKEKIQKKHKSIYKNSQGKSFPALLKEISDSVGRELSLSEEIT